MSKLLLIRHGETNLNSAKRFWGKTDVPLSAEGIKQAECLRDRLADQRIDAIYTSNMGRAQVTAKIIASKHQMDITTCPELREIDFGLVEGLTFEEIKQSHPELAELLFSWGVRPQFPSGESLDGLYNRVKTFIPRLEKHTPEQTVLIIAHSGPLRLLMCHLLGLDLLHWRQLRVDLASLSILETYPQGAMLNLLNDVSHLK